MAEADVFPDADDNQKDRTRPDGKGKDKGKNGENPVHCVEIGAFIRPEPEIIREVEYFANAEKDPFEKRQDPIQHIAEKRLEPGQKAI